MRKYKPFQLNDIIKTIFCFFVFLFFCLLAVMLKVCQKLLCWQQEEQLQALVHLKCRQQGISLVC